MKNIQFLVLIVLAVAAGCSKDDEVAIPQAAIAMTTEYHYSATPSFDKVELSSKEVFEYDRNGNLTHESWYDSNEQFEGKIIYQYTESGKMIEGVEYDENGTSGGNTYTQDYDDKGNAIAMNVYYNGVLEGVDSLSVDQHGNILEYRWVYFYDGIPYPDGFEPTTCKYDANNDMIEWKEDGLRRVYTYTKYDQYKNWLRRERTSYFSNQEAFGVTEREIEYY